MHGFEVMKAYTEAEKQIAVDTYFRLGSCARAVESLGYPSMTTLIVWAKRDPRWSKPTRRFKVFSAEVRQACVDDYLAGKGSLEEIAKAYGVASSSSVSHWVRKYLESGPEALVTKPKGDPAIARMQNRAKPVSSPALSEMSAEDLRTLCEQLQFENDVLKAEMDLFAKKARASAKQSSETQRKQS